MVRFPPDLVERAVDDILGFRGIGENSEGEGVERGTMTGDQYRQGLPVAQGDALQELAIARRSSRLHRRVVTRERGHRQ